MKRALIPAVLLCVCSVYGYESEQWGALRESGTDSMEKYFYSAGKRSALDQWEAVVYGGRTQVLGEWEKSAYAALREELLRDNPGFSARELALELEQELKEYSDRMGETIDAEIMMRKAEWLALSIEMGFPQFGREILSSALSELEIDSVEGGAAAYYGKWNSAAADILDSMWNDYSSALQGRRDEIYISAPEQAGFAGAALEYFKAKLEERAEKLEESLRSNEETYIIKRRNRYFSGLLNDTDSLRRESESKSAAVIAAAIINSASVTGARLLESAAENSTEQLAGPGEAGLPGESPAGLRYAIETGMEAWRKTGEELILARLEWENSMFTAEQEGEKC